MNNRFLSNYKSLPSRGVGGQRKNRVWVSILFPKPAVCQDWGRHWDKGLMNLHCLLISWRRKHRVTQCPQWNNLWTDTASFKTAEMGCLFGIWFLVLGQKKKKKKEGGGFYHKYCYLILCHFVRVPLNFWWKRCLCPGPVSGQRDINEHRAQLIAFKNKFKDPIFCNRVAEQ